MSEEKTTARAIEYLAHYKYLKYGLMPEWVWDMAIKALEQEPCEDAISRNKVLEGKVIHQSCNGVEIINSYAVPVEYIEQLPSIQPKPKTGHWYDKWGKDGCSVCNEGIDDAQTFDGRPFRYCPMCGARMEER